MSGKNKTVFMCSECGYESSKWNGKCPACNGWNTFEEITLKQTVKSGARKPVSVAEKIEELSEIDIEGDIRYPTGSKELDRVLGGGLVKGSLVLLGGEPGIGKSTLLLQICQYFGDDHTILYVSGEESVRQIKIRAQRLGVNTENLYLLSVTDAEALSDTISSEKP